MERLVRCSYNPEDVTVLLKDITGMLLPLPAAERERLIQSGRHYSELLPEEYSPTAQYLELYKEALERHAGETARAVVALSELIYSRKGGRVTLVSLARAGTPIGVLVKRYLQRRYKIKVPHYTISIIRDRGIDTNAMKYILKNHPPREIQFLDGWVGKGAIAGELKEAVKQYDGVDGTLAVLADPAGITPIAGTAQDFLIPSACLNAPVSGLFSRTVLNSDVIFPGDFHGAVYCEEMEKMDRTYEFIQAIEREERSDPIEQKLNSGEGGGLLEISKIADEFGISNINLIKPGIGETTRVLMRRVPQVVLVRDPSDASYIGHILRLCDEKQVEVAQYPLKHYRACGIISRMTDI